MSEPYILSCESTVDLPYSYVAGRNIPVLFYSYTIDGETFVDDMLRDPDALPHFYALLNAGKFSNTSQINTYDYETYFDEQLQKGDLLHIVFGSGMTASVRNAEEAADSMRKKYPDRKLIVIDSLCSSSGYGLLVDEAADRRDAGMSMEDLADWVIENRKYIHHQFYSTDLKYFRRGGRVSGPAAMIGTLLSICPIMRLDDKGRIIAYDKVRGKKNALRVTLEAMEAHAQNGTNYSGKCFICHSNCLTEALETKRAIEEKFPHIRGGVRICDIGTIIASHTGPGTVAVFFMGDARAPEK